jgi:hypothetical protein
MCRSVLAFSCPLVIVAASTAAGNNKQSMAATATLPIPSSFQVTIILCLLNPSPRLRGAGSKSVLRLVT